MRTVCIGTSCTLEYYQGGGHLWMHLNWALAFRRAGLRVIWADLVDADAPVDQTLLQIRELRTRLAPFGLDDTLALVPRDGKPLPQELRQAALNDDDAASADALFSFRYDYPNKFISRFRR